MSEHELLRECLAFIDNVQISHGSRAYEHQTKLIAKIDRHLAQPEAPQGEVRWLIERTYAKGKPAERREFWLGVTASDIFGDSFNINNEIWTINALEAARFSTKKIAEKLRYRQFHPEAPVEVCDHMFQCGVQPEAAPVASNFEVKCANCGLPARGAQCQCGSQSWNITWAVASPPSAPDRQPVAWRYKAGADDPWALTQTEPWAETPYVEPLCLCSSAPDRALAEDEKERLRDEVRAIFELGESSGVAYEHGDSVTQSEKKREATEIANRIIDALDRKP